MKKRIIVFLCLILILLAATSCKDGEIPEILEDNDIRTIPSQQEESITTTSESDEEESLSESESREDTSAKIKIEEDDPDNSYGPIIR